MNLGFVGLAIFMAAVTYPSRAVPLLAPGVERLPGWMLAYLRLVGPAVLAALAAVNVLVVTDAAGRPSFHFGLEPVAVAVGVVIVAWRRNLFLGILAAVVVTAVAR
ncbi:MAG TPA: AzlD domain-containing protein, partial [Candidatus Baltobacteraceae bacterium]|nr:AzlD domain-containing protein [Candidatus Baltobacteraceae bacterium]